MLKKLFYYLILCLLFLLQFVYFPFGTSYFENPKVYAAEVLIFCLLLVAILQGYSLFEKRKLPLLFAFGALIVLSLYQLIFLPTDYTFWGNDFRLQGVLLLWFLLLFSYLSSHKPIERVSPYLLISVLLLQFVLAIQVDSGSLERAVGSIGEPNSLAGIMIVTWPFLYFSVTKRRWRILSLLGSCILICGVLLLSGSRSGVVAFALQLVFLLCRGVFQWPVKRVVIVCLVLLVSSLVLPFLEQGSKYEKRTEVWQTGIVAGFAHPILGNGFGNGEFALNTAAIKLHNPLQGYYLDSAHNLLLDWWVQGGTLGLGIMLFLLSKMFFHFVQEKNLRNLIIALGLLAVLSFNPASVILLMYLWWLIGQSV